MRELMGGWLWKHNLPMQIPTSCLFMPYPLSLLTTHGSRSMLVKHTLIVDNPHFKFFNRVKVLEVMRMEDGGPIEPAQEGI